ncbi:sigma-70 family RNA polymerase sigma factor [Patescibacteria group bacterium]|nr:sigma-70 family RNA polymerase sigma factor [Patescibacteria group bacterium]
MFERLFAPKLDDNSLLQKAKESQSAFAEVYDRFANLVFRFVRRRVATDQDAEDIVSETFMAVAASLDHYDETKSKKCTTWILSIAHNKLQDYLRKIYNTPDIYDPEEHEIQDTSEDIMQATHDKHIYDEIMTYVQQLPDKQIAIFSLRHVE